MLKQLKLKKEPAETSSPYTSIAEAMFVEIVQGALTELQKKLPQDVAPEQMEKWILSFLDRAALLVHVRDRKGKISTAGCLEKIEHNLVCADPNEYRNIVLPFWTTTEFPVFQELLFDLRERAAECGLKANDAEPILRIVLEKRLPDSRPLKVQRGELRSRVISELRTIKARTKEFEGFEALKGQFPKFKVIEIVSSPEFDDDFRNRVASPGLWETKVVTFSHGILKKFWGLESEETLKGYRKAYHTHQKTTLGGRPRIRSKR
jgi:hypothetical protein